MKKPQNRITNGMEGVFGLDGMIECLTLSLQVIFVSLDLFANTWDFVYIPTQWVSCP